MSMRSRFGRDPSGYAFVAPAVLLFALVGIFPVLYSAGLSFFKWDGLSPAKWVGLGNFAQFLLSPTNLRKLFWTAMLHNLELAVATTVGVILISLPLASALNRAVRFRSFFRTTLLLPMVTNGIAVFYTWVFLFRAGGPVNRFFEAIKLHGLASSQGWLSDIRLALPAMVVVMIWGAVPLATLLYLSGLQTLDHNLYEAAELDGATRLQQLWHITWPLLRPITVIVVIVNIVGALQSYEMVYIMTNGGPTNHTLVAGLLAYNLAFGTLGGVGGQYGLASAIGWFLFLVLGAATFLLTRVLRPAAEG